MLPWGCAFDPTPKLGIVDIQATPFSSKPILESPGQVVVSLGTFHSWWRLYASFLHRLA